MPGPIDAVGMLTLVPQLVQVGQGIWDKIETSQKQRQKEKAKEKAPEAKSGVVDTTYYSSDHKFSIDLTDEKPPVWHFWKPTPQLLASWGEYYAWPTVDVPIMILSDDFVQGFQPYITVIVETVGPRMNITTLTTYSIYTLQGFGYELVDGSKKIDTDHSSSAYLAKTRRFAPNIDDKTDIYLLRRIYLRGGRAYYTDAMYVPDSDCQMPGTMAEIVNSFKMIKEPK